MNQISKQVLKALTDFVNAIDATGGVEKDEQGFMVPVADPEWIDLGEAYLEAKKALKLWKRK